MILVGPPDVTSMSSLCPSTATDSVHPHPWHQSLFSGCFDFINGGGMAHGYLAAAHRHDKKLTSCGIVG